IRPETHSPGMFSWFPILFPIKQPITVREGQTICVRFWRCSNSKKGSSHQSMKTSGQGLRN
ncbi:PRMT5 isoform 28, partial [Pongo abelii]